MGAAQLFAGARGGSVEALSWRCADELLRPPVLTGVFGLVLAVVILVCLASSCAPNPPPPKTRAKYSPDFTSRVSEERALFVAGMRVSSGSCNQAPSEMRIVEDM